MKVNTIQLKRTVSAVLFVLLLSAVGLTKAFTQSFTVGDLNYNINDDGVTVTVTGHVDGQSATGELVIPETITYNESTYFITAIGNNAFSECTGFTGNLVIPNSVTSIGSYAFYYCIGFTGNLTIGSSVTSIGSSAFRACTGFTGNLVIPNSVTSIGSQAFRACTGFTGDLVIPNSVTSIGGLAFNECTGFTGNLIIGNSVTTIGSGAFFYCTGFIGNLVIPNSVTSIGESVFRECTGFSGNLIIPNSVTSISDYAFCYCDGFTGNLNIPNSVTSIGNSAFYGCTGFSSVEYNAMNCADASSSYPPFENCGGTLIIGENVERIPANMFKWAAFTLILSYAEIPPTVGTDAFYGIDHDIPVYVPCVSLNDYQNAWGWKAFNNILGNSFEITVGDLNYSVNCDGTTTTVTVTGHVNGTAATGELVIPETITYNESTYSVTAIGNNAFSGCTGFTGNLVIPNSVTSIGSWAFYNCTGFTGNLVIPNSMTTIGDYAFRNCTNFSSVEYNATDCADVEAHSPFLDCSGTLTIGENVERIPAQMFSNATFTGSLIIPNSVTAIGSWAFYNCTGFTGNLVIPNSMTTIGDYAFRNCTNFSAVEYNATDCADASEYPFLNCGGTLTIGENVERIPAEMFCDATFTGSLIIPNSVTTIGYNAFRECTGFTGNLVISNSVTAIGEYAFKDCTGFSSVEYNATDCADVESYSPFENCGGTLTIGENVERIPANMFHNEAFTGSLIIPNSVTTIGYNAFRECTGFTGNLVIPNSVTAIGEYAFKDCTGFSSVEYNATDCADAEWYSPFENCGGTLTIGENVERIPAYMFKEAMFTLILSHAEIPPTIGTYAFYGIDHDIPVYVPCGSLSDYQNADGWNEFNNIFSNNCFEITVTVTPANSGTVTGAGTYNYGATAVLTATANEGYSFINWTKYDTVVTTNPTYSFIVTEDVDLVANFKLPGDANGDGIVDALDIVIIVNHIFGETHEEFVYDNADVNGDGIVDALDIVIIVNIIFSKKS